MNDMSIGALATLGAVPLPDPAPSSPPASIPPARTIHFKADDTLTAIVQSAREAAGPDGASRSIFSKSYVDRLKGDLAAERARSQRLRTALTIILADDRSAPPARSVAREALKAVAGAR